MNLYLHGAQDFRVTQGDTLRSPNYMYRGELQTFDCVVANPPFGLKNWGADAFASDVYGRNIWGCPTDASADFAWIQHIVKSMDKKNGRAAFVISQGVLFHTGKEGLIREALIKSDKLEAVITLASGVFFGTTVSACILVLNNNKPEEHKGKILLVDASKIYTSQIAQNVLSEEDVLEVYQLYQGYKDVIGKSKVITVADAVANGYSLGLNNYIERPETEMLNSETVYQKYNDAVNAAISAENRLKKILIKEGLLNE
jgi:type I restriction enzyme M protein